MVRVPAPSRVIASVTALTVCSVAALPLYESGTVGPSALLIPVALLLVVSWLVRMAQWVAAAGAPAQPGELVLHLAQGAPPAERGRAMRTAGRISRAGGIDPAPRGYAAWAVLTDRRGRRLHQRVVWEPWLRDLTGPHAVRVRRRAGVTVIDVDGRGRLWPASLALSRSPWGVKLVPLGGRAGTGLTRWRLLAVLLPVAALGAVPHLADGDVPAVLWALAYVTALTFAIGQWFGIVPPGAPLAGQPPEAGPGKAAKPPRQRSKSEGSRRGQPRGQRR
ncbi:hypothetical protein CS0771_51870 [Catellatospora sp. IY07-71]|uniref:hypothetical protein n=1 Tax=Catellatospora sp. IY07-71 TaxID=2728827 RepID=UPI001BB3BFC5|nr:hypothetical protein [Catellatospora sp. IY07-71]BCJ75643.1 hypothetical protein CS0771_51870 [Catellatospora sp. IY07-71]